VGLFRRSSKLNRAETSSVTVSVYLGETPLKVVGESHRQGELKQLLNSCGREVLAVLVPELKNQYDPNAIMVWATSRDGKASPMHVGYLSRRDAAEYLLGLIELMRESDSGSVGLYAKITGGESNKPSLGILLFHDPEDFSIDDAYEDDDNKRS